MDTKKIILFIFPIIFAAMTGLFHREKNQKTTKGRIISLECVKHGVYTSRDDSHKPVYRVRIEYEVKGKYYSFVADYASSGFREGMECRVGYNKYNPEEAHLMPSFSNYVIFLILFAVAAIAAFTNILF